MQQKQTFLDNEKGITDLKTFLNLADIATSLRRQRQEVERQLSIEEEKAFAVQKLMENAKARGDSITEREAGLAVENYFDGMYTFKEPPKSLSTSLANLYVDRSRIFWRRAVPVAALATLACVGWLAVKGANAVRLAAKERAVESAVLTAYQETQAIKSGIRELRKSPFRELIPSSENTELESLVASAESKTGEADIYLARYCPNGTARDAVTRENFEQVRESLKPLTESLREATTRVDGGKTLILKQQQIVSLRQSLDAIIQQIRNDKPLDVFMQRAESFYASGIVCLNNRQVGEVEGYQNQLRTLKRDAADFSDLTRSSAQIYDSVKAVAKEEQAIKQADSFYQGAKSAITSADVGRLREEVGRLGELNQTLNQEYTLRVRDRPGLKSGDDRYYTDKQGRRASGYYLILEAVDSRGNIIERAMKNEETGNVERVRAWGERVPQQVYERIKQDKMRDGRVDDNTFGRKERGYLSEKLVMQGIPGKQGQITRWEENR